MDQAPRLRNPALQAFTLNALAHGYQFSGQPGRSVTLFRRANTIQSELKRDDQVSIGLGNLSDALRLTGALGEAEWAARHALDICRARKDRHWEAVSLYSLELTLVARDAVRESASALQRSLRIWIAHSDRQGEGLANTFLAQQALFALQATLAILALRAEIDKRLFCLQYPAVMKGGTGLRRTQVSATLDDAMNERIEQAVTRYGKLDKAQIVREMFVMYFDLYVEIEEARLQKLLEQRAHLDPAAKPQRKK